MNLHDGKALEAECKLARTHGFSGKIAVSPRQISAINREFSPTLAEIERARRLIKVFREGKAMRRGVMKFEGMMADHANLRRAERILAQAQLTEQV
jgi:citrate lyase subunit beta/citryl-CoA lyase